jgi:hypothetical protein
VESLANEQIKFSATLCTTNVVINLLKGEI